MNVGSLLVLLKLNNQLTPALTKAAAGLQATGRRMQATGSLLTKAISLPLAAIGGAAVFAFGSFDKAMTESLAIMGDVSDVMKQEMSDAAREMAKTTVFSAKEAAESYFFLASAGFDAAESIAALPQVAAFAQAGMFDMARATDLLTDAHSALGLNIGTITERMESMARVSDVLVGANTLANASVEQFATALTSKAGAAMKGFNIDVEEGVAVLAAYADQGVKAEIAGNNLDRILRLLPKAVLENSEAFKLANVEVFDAQGNMNNLGVIIEQLSTHLEGMSDRTKTVELDLLGFDARVAQIIKPLLGMGEAIQDNEAALRKMGGITQEVADKQLESLFEKLGLLKDRLTDVFISLGEELVPVLETSVMPAFESLIESAAGAVRWFGELPTGVKNTTIAFFGLAAVLGPLMVVISKFVGVISWLVGSSGVILVTGAVTTLANTVPVLTARLWLMNAAAAAGTTGFGLAGLAGAIGVATFAMVRWIDTQTDFSNTLDRNNISIGAFLQWAGWMGDSTERRVRSWNEEMAIIAAMPTVHDRLTRSVRQANAALDAMEASGDKVGFRYTVVEGVLRKVDTVTGDLIETLAELADATGGAADEIQEIDVKAKKWKVNMADLPNTLSLNITQINAMMAAIAGASIAMVDINDHFIRANELLTDFSGAPLPKTVAALDETEKATRRAGLGFSDFTEIVRTGNRFIDQAVSLMFKLVDSLIGGGGLSDAFGKVGSGASSFFSKIGGLFGGDGIGAMLGKAFNFLPVVGPLLAAFGGPLLKGLKSLGSSIGGFFKGIFGGGESEASKMVGAMDALFARSISGAGMAEAAGRKWAIGNIAIREAYLAVGRSLEESIAATDRLAAASGGSTEEAMAATAAIQAVFDEMAAGAQQTTDAVTESITTISDTAVDAVKQTADAVTESITTISDTAVDAVVAQKGAVSQLGKQISDTFKNMEFEVPVNFSINGPKGFDFDSGSFGGGKLDKFHTGGTVPGPIGAPRVVVALGGEKFTPPGGGGGDSSAELLIEIKTLAASLRRQQDVREVTHRDRSLMGM